MAIIYIAGAISGQQDYNVTAFRRKDEDLSYEGNVVINPTRYIPIHNPEAIPQEAYMKISYAMIDACDTVYFLQGWRDSVGATKEYDYAINHDKMIRFEPEK